MSHFAVLVIGPDVEGQMAPYHEFECTGQDDQYVQNIDRTQEMRDDYEKHESTRYKDTAGGFHDPYDDRFYREPTQAEKKQIGPLSGTGGGGGISWTSKDWGDGNGYRPKVHFVPEGWSEVKVPVSAIETFSEWIEGYHGQNIVPFGQSPDLDGEHKYGYAEVDKDANVIKVIDRTNPNKKWDWYRVGGRWAGHFKLKEGATAPAPQPGYEVAFGQKEPDSNTADVVRKGDVDFAGMRDDAEREAFKRYNFAMSLFNGLKPNATWDEVRDGEEKDVEKSRTAYWAQPRCKAWRGADREKMKEAGLDSFFGSPDDFLVTRERYIQSARDGAFSTFAVVLDGKWHEKGQMGWFASVRNEKDPETWPSMFAKLIDDLSDDTQLTVVDCHI